METVFKIVYDFLKWLEALTGFSYREINIIVYFIIIPAVFVYLIGKLLSSKIPFRLFLGLLLIALVTIPNFEVFSIHAFDVAVDFLNWFDNIGLNYIEASVVICVLVPILIIIGLVVLKKRRLVLAHKNNG